MLYPIVPKQTEYKIETIRIYDKFQNFIAFRCSYEVVKPELYVFEKHWGYLNIEKTIEADKDEFVFKNNTIIYKYELDSAGQTTTSIDTTEILNFE